MSSPTVSATPISPMNAFHNSFPPFPDEIIQVANQLISDNLTLEGHYIVAKFSRGEFLRKSVEAIIKWRGLSLNQPNLVALIEDEIKSKKWLDIAPMFQAIAWVVRIVTVGEDHRYEFEAKLPTTVISRAVSLAPHIPPQGE